ncbi:MAG: YihY/virulence factor BrkB family protein [Anaerolineae bacterium]|nr:YihY/virulence factor BrkB family protein [Anaerolineae bacterium]
MNAQGFLELAKQTFSEWNEDKAPQLAAALAYYTIFSIAPLLIIVIGIAGLVFGQEAVRGQIVGQIQGMVGQQGAELIQTMIQNASRPAAGVLATIIGFVTLLAGAAGVFSQMKATLNQIWDVPPKQGPGGIKGIIASIKQQFISFTMVLGVGFLLLVSLVLSAGLQAAGKFLGDRFGVSSGIWEIINFVVSFGVITLLFAAIYKVLPDLKIAWRDVWIGAAVTALLFTIGKWLIGLYLGHSSTASSYGAAGSLVILLLWIYYSAQILFLGAEFTQVYARKHGSMSVEAQPEQAPAEAKLQKPVRPMEPVAAAVTAAAAKEHAEKTGNGSRSKTVVSAVGGVINIAAVLAPLAMPLLRLFQAIRGTNPHRRRHV